MKIIIGSARADENYKYVGGRRGDQRQKCSHDMTGEVSMQEFYINKLGWYVLRPKDDNVALNLAKAMEDACNNKHFGYSQSDRYSVFKKSKNKDIKEDVNCDCTSLVRKCIIDASGKDVGDFTTVNEASVLEKSGLFESKKQYKSGMKLYTGDVLVTKTKGHTVVVVSGNDREAEKHESKSSGSKSKSYTIGKKYTVLDGGLNMRDKPSIDGNIITVLKKGDKLTCKQTKTISDSIWLSNGAGWVCAVNSNGKVYVD